MSGETEEWLPVVGEEGLYEVSSLGRVRSVRRTFIRKRDRAACQVGGRILKLAYENGWPTVTLGNVNGRSRRARRVRVAYLVVEAFTAWTLDENTIAFRNNDARDCRLANLRAIPTSNRSEAWRPCPGWEGSYEVSDLGRVRSMARSIMYGRNGVVVVRKVRPRILRPGSVHGYPSVNLRSEGASVSMTIHSLVAAAFHGPRPPEMQVRHLDGNRSNSRADNLAYGSRRANEDDKYVHGFARLAGLSIDEVRSLIAARQ